MARRTSRVISETEVPALLSENEVKVLLYMKDQQPHHNPPEGMQPGQFSVVCEMLKDRKYIKEVKSDDIVAWNEPTSYHIMPKGYEAVLAIERERKAQHTEETQRKKAIISVDELNSLFANVVKRHGYYSNFQWQPTFWDEAMAYLVRLSDSEQPAMHIYSITNELSTLKTNSFMWSGFGTVYDGNRIAFQMYIVIYYKYRDHPVYKTMLKALAPVTGVLGRNGRLDGLNQALDQAIKTREIIMAGVQQEKAEVEKPTQGKETVPSEEKPVAGMEEPSEEKPVVGMEEPDADAQSEDASDYLLKLRIELLNFLLARAGFSLAVIKEKRLVSNMVRLYRIILGGGAESLLKENIGKVVYKEKPAGLGEKVKEINRLLMKINEEWSIKL